MKKLVTPYQCHLLICTKSRNNERKSCGDTDSPDLKKILKEAVVARGLKGRVRISDTGCLGVCEAGPNIMLYPQKIWFSGVTQDDLPEILETVEEAVR